MEEAFVSFNFIDSFPYKYYISTWSHDESYPEGFRYKLLSVRHSDESFIETILLLQERNMRKTEMKRIDIKESEYDRLISIMLASLEETFDISFEKQDYSTCSSYEEFESMAKNNGWLFCDNTNGDV